MALKNNLYYWEFSLNNPEPIVDEYYIFDKLIITDQNLLKKVERLRELVISYCVMSEKDKKSTSKILEEIYEILTSMENIQYHEFVAFWKALDMSYSVFIKLPNTYQILEELLRKYCERRRKIYDRLGYSNVTVQALYDSGSSRKKGSVGITKIIDILNKTFNSTEHLKNLEDIRRSKHGFFLPDKGDKKLFKEFLKEYKINYEFGKTHQNKEPDVVFKYKDEFFIIEAKHIKESGGAQDKQIVEIIDFIKYREKSKNFHYVSFMDGIYFNNFIAAKKKSNTNLENLKHKVDRQIADIETHLKQNKNNFFVNTAGFNRLLKDIKGR